jgi:RHS repeat-associated protein
VSTATNEAGIVTATVYESTYHTFPSQQTIGGLFTSTSDYDERSGKLLSSMDIKGLVTANIYDPFLRPLETDVSTTSNGTANVWLARYDYTLGMASGFSTNSVRVRKSDGVDASNGHETWTYADGLGRVFQTRDESETSGSYRVSDTVYDKRGDVQFVLLPYFSSGTAFTKPTSTEMGALHIYDPVARLTNVTAAVNGTFTSGLLTSTSLTGGDANSPIGSVSIAFNFGNDPWTWVVTDEAGKVHRYSLDGYGRTNQIVEVVGASIYTTRLAYNPASDLTNITDNAGNQIQFGVNDLGQMIALADPDMGIWQYQRDFAGRIRNQIDANNQKIVFNYNDPLGRLKSRQIYDFHTNFVYGLTNIYDVSDDANFPAFPGQLYKVIDKEGFSKNGYDLRGRALKTARFLNKNGSTYTNQFAYDDANRARQIIYPNGGPTITNIFDTGGNLFQVKQVGGSGTAFYTAQGFTALDQLTGITFGNGVTTAYSYYSNSKRLQQLVTSGSKQNLTYTYDQVSNIKSIADAAYSSTNSAALSSLTYDDLHQLTSLTRPAIGQTTPFSFDSIGNFSVNGENGAGAYNYGVRMPHAVKSANGQTNAYDACGNMMVRGNQRLAYDPENHLAYVVTPTGGIYFGYDAADARLWKSSVNGLQVWIGGNYEEKNGLILFHIFAGDQTVCTFDKFGTNVFAYYHPDPLHSTSIETDQSGNRIQHYEYMAFGKDRYTESSTEFPISRRYTGQVLDDETGLYYYNARYYDPQLGRFIQADTIIPDIFNPQTYNRYAYCGNNPLKNTDPSGHNWAVFTWDAWKQLASDIFIGDTGSSRVDPNSAAGLRNSMGVGVTPLRDEHGNIVQPGDAVKQIGGAVVGGVIDTAMYLGGEGEAKGAYQAADKLLEAKKFENAAADIHHIATDKNLISKAAGGPFTPKFEALFEKGGMTLQDALNKVPVLGHKGPHAEYNKIVYQRLSQAVEGLKGNAYKQALQNQLKAIGEESATKGSALNKLITK